MQQRCRDIGHYTVAVKESPPRPVKVFVSLTRVHGKLWALSIFYALKENGAAD